MRDTLKAHKYLDTSHINICHVLSMLGLAPAVSCLQYFNFKNNAIMVILIR